MKFVILFAVAIVAVSGKPLTTNDVRLSPEFIQTANEMKNEFKDVEATMHANRGDAATATMEFMTSIDKETRTLILKDSAKIINVIIDITKTIQERLDEVAVINRNSADLWDQAAKIHKEQNPTSVTKAAPAA